jgi:hypothetical protein
MWKIVLITVVAAVLALLAYAGTRPDTFSVQRSVRVAAPAEKLYPLINDLHAFNRWNPFNKKDPGIKGSYEGPASGPGASYSFKGDSNVGKGRIEVTGGSAPQQVLMRLTMQEPMAGRNEIEFKLVPQGATTEVTWAMHGPSPYIAKLVGVVFNMDKMIGTDFEAGLASLKALAEQP